MGRGPRRLPPGPRQRAGAPEGGDARRLEDLLGSIARFQDEVLGVARPYALEQLPALYGAAAQRSPRRSRGPTCTSRRCRRSPPTATTTSSAAPSRPAAPRSGSRVRSGPSRGRGPRSPSPAGRQRAGRRRPPGPTRGARDQCRDVRERRAGADADVHGDGRRTKTGVAHNLGGLRGMQDAGVSSSRCSTGPTAVGGHTRTRTRRTARSAGARRRRATCCPIPTADGRSVPGPTSTRRRHAAAAAQPSTTADGARRSGPVGGPGACRGERRAESRLAARDRLAAKRAARAAQDPLAGVDLDGLSDDALEQLANLDRGHRGRGGAREGLRRARPARRARRGRAGPARAGSAVGRRRAHHGRAYAGGGAAPRDLLRRHAGEGRGRTSDPPGRDPSSLVGRRRRSGPGRSTRCTSSSTILSAEEATRGALFSAEGRRANVQRAGAVRGRPAAGCPVRVGGAPDLLARQPEQPGHVAAVPLPGQSAGTRRAGRASAPRSTSSRAKDRRGGRR